MDIKDLTIKKIQEGLKEGDLSSFDLTQSVLEHVEEKDGDIKAYLEVFKDSALSQAKDVDVASAEDKPLDPLAGVPIALKDNMLLKGKKVTAGSQILKDYTSSYNSTVAKKLKDQSAVFVGRTNMDEFAMGSSTENSSFNVTKNPVDLERVPGGSSGGSAAAVAAGEAVAALGSDTGGSIRQPAAFCGVVGLKPTYGAVSRHGLIAMASSLDQIGPITKTVEDASILFNAIKGKDFYDSTSTDKSDDSDLLSLDKVKDFTVGIPEEFFSDGLDDEVKMAVDEAIEDIKSLGLNTKKISLPHSKYALACYYIIMPAEVSSNLARFDGIRYSRISEKVKSLSDHYFKQRGKGFGEESKRRILLGTFVLSSGYYDAYYGKAQKVRRLIKNDFDDAFEDVDVILTPTTPTPAFKIGEKADDPLSMYLSDIFTVPANLAGLPAISIPVRDFKTSENLPVGFQLIGNYFKEQDILSLGRFYERIND